MLSSTMKILTSELAYARNMISAPSIYDYHGVKIPTRRLPHFKAIRRRLYRSTYERGEIEAVSAIVEPDDRVVEFGCGLGVVSMRIARRLSESSNLTSYEANFDLRADFEALSEANGATPRLINAVVGAENGQIEFNITENFLSSSLHERAKKKGQKIKVPQIALEDILGEMRPSVIVFDIEGGETIFEKVQLPEFVRALSGEFHPHIIGNAAITKIVGNLINQGFVMKPLENFGWVFPFIRRSLTT